MTIDPLFLDQSFSIARPGRYYSLEIDVSHHQLRNFISTVYQGKIFYVNKHDIYILDLESGQLSLLVTVNFETRCLAAAHGWVCVGGESKGDCAFIHIGEKDGQPGDFCLEVESRMMGKEIVNAMNIQVLKPDTADVHAKDDIVVLISNNDRTITVYSLSQRLVLTKLDYPQPMNYASLSPDSTIMAAVGDENKVYFQKRSLSLNSSEPRHDAPYFAEYDWGTLATPGLPPGTPLSEDFSFAIAFSPNGRLCAVSSQGGAITVFDVDKILSTIEPAEDAIICTFRSSRESLWGCVRSMAFSPAPWNLLAWTEDHGRIGLADVKQGFQRRQQIQLSKDKCKEVEIEDMTPSDQRLVGYKERILLQEQRQRQHRVQNQRGHPPIGARSLSDDRDTSDTYGSPTQRDADRLTERERLMNRELETTLDEAAQHPYSVSYVSSQPETRPSAANAGLRRSYEVQLINPSSRFLLSHIPRRRASVILSDNQSSQRLVVDETSRITMTASPGPISDDGMPPLMSTNDLTPSSGTNSSQPLPYNIPPSDPWHVIEASLASRRNERSGSGSSSRLLFCIQQIDNAIFQENQVLAHLDRQLNEEQALSRMLRSALDIRGQQEQLRQLEDPLISGRHSPRTERVLTRQLWQDLDDCETRIRRLAGLRQQMPTRVSQLEDERDVMLQQHRNPSYQEISSPTSGQSSALPTIFVRGDSSESEWRLQRGEGERQLFMRQIEEMERGLRRAENNIEVATFPNTATSTTIRDRIRNRFNGRDRSMLISTRLLAGTQSGTTISTPGSEQSPPSTRPGSLPEHTVLPAANQRSDQRNTLSRALEPRITPANAHAARLWAYRNHADFNGNWRRPSNTRPSNLLGHSTALEEILEDAGIGTAGIGWSPDGLKL